MEIIEVNSSLPYILNGKPIGMGTTAICFKEPNGMVFKKFVNTSNTKELFRKGDMIEKLSRMEELTNDTYVGPEKLVLVKGKLSGYMYPYVPSKTLKHISKDTKLFDLFKGYEKLMEDTKTLSSKGFRLVDTFTGDIFFDESFKIIDIDRGYYNDVDTSLYRKNIDYIFKTLLKYIFDAYQNELVQPLVEEAEFYHIWNRTNPDDINQVYRLLEYIAKKCKDSNPSIRSIRRNIDVDRSFDEYHNKR